MSQSLPPTSLAGCTLSGIYRVDRLLGQGAMGAVWEAQHLGTGGRVALKVLGPEYAEHPDSVLRLQREARAAAGLGHPNVVSVVDFRSDPGQPVFLVMERLEGESLEARIRRFVRLPWEQVRSIAVQVLSALEAAHAAGIVHRDIKPSNLFLVSIPRVAEVVKVLDFGVAKLARGAPITDEGALLGTPLYMAPEQALAEPGVDGRADLFGLSATLYHALTGQPPFVPSSMMALITHLREGTTVPIAERVSGVPAALCQVIERGLARQVQDRWQSATEMQRALDWEATVPSGALLSSYRPSASPPTPRFDDAATLATSTASAYSFPRPSALPPGPPQAVEGTVGGTTNLSAAPRPSWTRHLWVVVAMVVPWLLVLLLGSIVLGFVGLLVIGTMVNAEEARSAKNEARPSRSGGPPPAASSGSEGRDAGRKVLLPPQSFLPKGPGASSRWALLPASESPRGIYGDTSSAALSISAQQSVFVTCLSKVCWQGTGLGATHPKTRYQSLTLELDVGASGRVWGAHTAEDQCPALVQCLADQARLIHLPQPIRSGVVGVEVWFFERPG